MYLNVDTEDNLMLCAEAGEHDNTTGHVLAECPTYSEGEE